MTSNSIPPSVGQRLAAARLQRGLAQTDVARRAGLAPSYLSRIENGKVQPTFPTVMSVVHAIGADPSEIVGPVTPEKKSRGPCPVTARGRCLLDLIGTKSDEEHYTPREIRMLKSFAALLKSAKPERVRAMEVLLESLAQAAKADDG
jgi:transcriptional regulator with XRE-family HTH domain